MYKILTVTPNPALDVSARTPEVKPTSKLRCHAVERHPGGGGINVARVLHRLGEDVAALYTEGGTTGSLLTELLAQEGVRCLPVKIAGHTRESFTVQDERNGEEFRFVLPGPEVSPTVANAVLAQLSGLQVAPAFIVASGSLAPGMSDDWYAQLIAQVSTAGSKVVVDTSGAPLRAALDAGAFMIKPSLREMRELVGLPLTRWSELAAACAALLDQSKLALMVVSLGEQGALMHDRNGCWYAPPLAVEVRSAVGAGDSFVAGMVGALARGLGSREAFAMAVAAASAALASSGTGLCAPKDVQRLLPQVQCLTTLPSGSL